MPELKIPDDLKNDCENCQGLCCMAMVHEPSSHFPILNAKPAGIPCEHLEIDPDSERQLYHCEIHKTLEGDGWETCHEFDCFGAGQTISTFFKTLGVSWAEKNTGTMSSRDRRTHEYNLRGGYMALYNALRILNMLKTGQNFVVYYAAREALKATTQEFALELERTDGHLDERYWGKTFRNAIDEAILPLMSIMTFGR